MSGQKPGSTKQSMSALYALAEVSRNRLGIRDRNNSSISHDRLPEILCGDDVAQEDGVTVDNYLVQDEVFTVQKKTIETDESGMENWDIVASIIIADLNMTKFISPGLVFECYPCHQIRLVTQTVYPLLTNVP